MKNNMLSTSQKNFVDIAIHHPKIIKTISSKQEYEFKNILLSAGFIEGKDYFHQHPFSQSDVGLVAVADFAFLKEKIIIELDGKSHQGKIKREHDQKRDAIFNANKFTIIRIKTPMDSDQKSYWKIFIKTIINDIREQHGV